MAACVLSMPTGIVFGLIAKSGLQLLVPRLKESLIIINLFSRLGFDESVVRSGKHIATSSGYNTIHGG